MSIHNSILGRIANSPLSAMMADDGTVLHAWEPSNNSTPAQPLAFSNEFYESGVVSTSSLILSTAMTWLSRFAMLYGVFILLVAVIMTLEEVNVWKRGKKDGLVQISMFGKVKIFVMNVVWQLFCLAYALSCLPRYFLTGHAEEQAFQGEVWSAKVLQKLFLGEIEVKGELPPADGPAPVYICNHTSTSDGIAFYLAVAQHRPTNLTGKSVIKFLPGIGLLAALSGDVLINRKRGKNKQSISNMYEQCQSKLSQGWSVMFFPQGTRRMTERLPLKNGAFNVALQNKAPIVPISLETPVDLWNTRNNKIVVTIHKAIEITGNEDREELKQQCFETLYSVLPDYRKKDE